jgi:hypothetical protein
MRQVIRSDITKERIWKRLVDTISGRQHNQHHEIFPKYIRIAHHFVANAVGSSHPMVFDAVERNQ